MLLIGSKAFEYHGIHLPRPAGYVSDIDLIMDESEFADCLDKKFFISWQTVKPNKIFAYDSGHQKYEIDLVKYVRPFSGDVDTSSPPSNVLLHKMMHSYYEILFQQQYTSTACKHCGCPGENHNRAIGGAAAGVLDGVHCAVPSKEILFAIKASHITFPVNWYKNIEDYHFLKQNYFKNFDIKSDKNAFKIYVKRKQETKQRVDTKINLNVKNEEFFNQYNINRLIDHDKLHEMVAVFGEPMHNKIRKDKDNAYCDESLWNQLAWVEQLSTVAEEAAVIALERVIIPRMHTGQHVDADNAYRWALMRICTTLTSGWFRDFAIEHWPQLKVSQTDLTIIAEKVLSSIDNR